MIKEEWRLHISLVGGFGSGFFPILIFILTSICAFISPYIMIRNDVTMILFFLHITSLIYGIFVGGFGRIGEHVMTHRLGQVNMLLQLPQLYPIRFKHIMGIFYLKDLLYYLAYSYVPMVLGAILTAPSVDVTYRVVFLLGITMFIVFVFGMGLSFTLSALDLRSRKATFLLSFIFVCIILLAYPLNLIQVKYLLPVMGFWESSNPNYLILSVIYVILFSLTGVFLMKEKFETKQESRPESLIGVESKFQFVGDLRTIVAKEWLELVRSDSLYPAIVSFSGHLLVIYAVSWIFQVGFGMPIRFNLVFYSGFVGFMGVMTYSFLTNLEHNEYLNVQPISVGMVIKAKIIVYLVITSAVIFGYVFLIGYLKNEMSLIPIGLLVATSTSLFVVAVTAYLTGLWTNTMFFGAKTIIRFAAIVIPPLTLIEIAAMMLGFRPYLATLLLYCSSIALLISSILIFKRLEKKWGNSIFSYVSTGV